MNYFSELSLQRRAIVKIAINFWTKHCLNYLSQCDLNHKEMKDDWDKRESIVMNKANKLNLKYLLKEEMLHVVKLIGFRILAWVSFHEQYKISVRLPKTFFWTPRGTVDLKRTAEDILYSNESLDDRTRYNLACIYCIDDKIGELYERLNFFYLDLETFYYVGKEPALITFWTYEKAQMVYDLLKKVKINTNEQYFSPYEHALYYAVEDLNEPAAKYFLQKVSNERKVQKISDNVSGILNTPNYKFTPGTEDEYFCDVLCCLLSALTLPQQKEILKQHSSVLLEHLLVWPWQDYFMQAADYILKDIEPEKYMDLLLCILAKIKKNYRDYDYKDLFQKVWAKSKISHKQYVLREFLTSETSRVEVKSDASDEQPTVKPPKTKWKIFRIRGKRVVLDKKSLIEYILTEIPLLKKSLTSGDDTTKPQ